MDIPGIFNGLSPCTESDEAKDQISPTDKSVSEVASSLLGVAVGKSSYEDDEAPVGLKPAFRLEVKVGGDDLEANEASGVSMPFGTEMFKLQEKLRQDEIQFIKEAMTPEALKNITSPKNSIMAHLESIYGEGKVTLESVGKGFSQAKKVIVEQDNGKAKTVSVLKSGSIPKKVWEKRAELNQFLSQIKEQLTLYQKLKQLFFEKPCETFNREDPHISSMKWEFLGQIIGKHLSPSLVPETYDMVYIPYPENQDWLSHGDKLKEEDSETENAQCMAHLSSEENCGFFSLQSFVYGAQSALDMDIIHCQEKGSAKFDMESLQFIALFDMLTQAEDSNSGNILLKQDNEGIFHGIKIDHDPLVQPSYFNGYFNGHLGKYPQELRKIPCWVSWEFLIKEPLQEKVKKKIEELKLEEIICEAEKQGMPIDDKTLGKLKFNIQFFQDAIKNGPHHTLEELYVLFLKSGGKNDFLTTISPAPATLRTLKKDKLLEKIKRLEKEVKDLTSPKGNVNKSKRSDFRTEEEYKMKVAEDVIQLTRLRELLRITKNQIEAITN